MIRLTRGLGVAFAGSFLATEGRIKVNLSGILGIYTLIALSHFAVCLVTNLEDSKGADQCRNAYWRFSEDCESRAPYRYRFASPQSA